MKKGPENPNVCPKRSQLMMTRMHQFEGFEGEWSHSHSRPNTMTRTLILRCRSCGLERRVKSTMSGGLHAL